MRVSCSNNRITAYCGWVIARAIALLVVFAAAVSGTGAEAFAEIAGEDALYSSTWHYLFEDALTTNGVVQCICSTPDYLITIENTADDPSLPDTVSAYYKNPYDRDGNPVQQYSLAMRNTDFDWEHGNGITYNPNTNELYVALYTNLTGDNEGTLYIMDPDTLSYKGKIKIAEGYNILGIDYDAENDEYYTLTDASAGFSLQKRDAQFNLIDDYGPLDPAPGNNFQDICHCGDYIFLSPVTFGLRIGDFMNVYSLSRREYVTSIDMKLGLEGVFVEVEGVGMAQNGEFVCPVTVTLEDGTHQLYYYATTLPWYYTIETSARGLTYEGERTIYTVDNGEDPVNTYTMDMELYTGNGNGDRPLSENGNGDRPLSENGNTAEEPLTIGGTVSAGSRQVVGGTNYTVTFEPDPGYKVAAAYLDITPLELPEGANSYTLENVSGNHRITADFIPIEKPTPSPAPAENEAAADGEDAAGDNGSPSETQISAEDEAGARPGADSSHKTAARRKTLLFTVLILIILLLGLALFVLYYLHVRRVREQKLRARREERRQRRLRPEAEEREEEAERAGRKRAKRKEGERETGRAVKTKRVGMPDRTGRSGKADRTGKTKKTRI